MASGKATTNAGGLGVSYDWTRNRAGNILSETGAVTVNSVPTADPINVVTAYAYDKLGRLASYSRGTSTTSYGWQAVPNRTSVQIDGQTPTTFSFDAANRETTSDLGNIYYDAEGRLTARPGQLLEWNDLGQLVTVKDAQSQAVIAAYTYDALDRLLTVTHGSDVVRLRYVGLTTQLAQVVDDTTGTVRYSVANGWSGERLFSWDATSEAFFGTNGHHDVTWTAAADGTVSATLLYDPWGGLVASSGSTLPDFRFQGSWFDPAAELSWVVTRWYAPQLARFISEDSLLGDPADPPSRHLYAYGAGEPVGRWDPDGMYYREEGGSSWGWFMTLAGDTPTSLAEVFLGSRRMWPRLYNRNRSVFQWPTSRSAGSCVLLPKSATWRRAFCAGGKPTGRRFREWWVPASDTLRVDWWMLTQWDLEALTERETGFSNAGDGEIYERNLAEATRLGIAAWAVNDSASPTSVRAIKRTDRYAVVLGDPNACAIRLLDVGLGCFGLPFGTASATTIGNLIFVRDRTAVHDMFLLGHEYIHIMQYAGRRNQIDDYLDEYDRLGPVKGGGPRNRFEAIGYLWEAWMYNYFEYGGPTTVLPQWRWKVPTRERVQTYLT